MPGTEQRVDALAPALVRGSNSQEVLTYDRRRPCRSDRTANPKRLTDRSRASINARVQLDNHATNRRRGQSTIRLTKVKRTDLMGFVGSVLGAGSAVVAAGGSALTGSDPLVEVWRQTVRPLVVRR